MSDLTRRDLVAAAPAAIIASLPAIAATALKSEETHPDAELLALRSQFERLHAEWQDLVERAEILAPPAETYTDVKLRSAEIKRLEKESGFLDALSAAEAKASKLDAVAHRVRALSARTLQGFAVKARLTQFDAGLSWRGRMQGPEEDWDWDVRCMEHFVREIDSVAGLPVRGGLDA